VAVSDVVVLIGREVGVVAGSEVETEELASEVVEVIEELVLEEIVEELVEELVWEGHDETAVFGQLLGPVINFPVNWIK
jgi:hypothetical protein